jgi:AcrR family transcriptional regulator
MAGDTNDAAAGDGRSRLIDTAEVLFDENGIDGTSARAIGVAAGHRNVAAVNYHFGTKDELLRAVLARWAARVDAERIRRFDELEAAGSVTPREALVTMMDPLVELLDDAGGRRYLRLLNHAANHPAYYTEGNVDFAAGLARGAAHLSGLLEDLPPPRAGHRAQITLGLVLYALADQARLIDAGAPHRPTLDSRAFATDLVDVALAALTAR